MGKLLHESELGYSSLRRWHKTRTSSSCRRTSASCGRSKSETLIVCGELEDVAMSLNRYFCVIVVVVQNDELELEGAFSLPGP